MKNSNAALPEVVLVTGGAGYIGSHTVFALAQEGYRVIVIDNFHQQQIIHLPFAEIIHGDFADEKLLRDVFTRYDIKAVFHFAALIEVGESVLFPQEFYHNNVFKTAILLRVMLHHGIKKIIFSSSCAVYGVPQYIPMDEKHPQNPISPYGKTKLAVEFMLQDYAAAYGLLFANLRYFNAAGAQWQLGLGERHTPESHLIPRLFQAIMADKDVMIFGKDYPTPDGTCIRDYVHVQDLAAAHVLAFKSLSISKSSFAVNVGTGKGYSVLDVVAIVEQVCSKKARVQLLGRRDGDVPVLLADVTFMRQKFNWQPEYSDLVQIVQSAYEWHKQQNEEKIALHALM